MKQYILTISDAGKPSIAEYSTPAPPQPLGGKLRYSGMNLCGGGTGWPNWLANGGPVPGQHYLFPNIKETADLVATGANIFRVLFTWEALQPSPYSDINANVGPYKVYADALFAVVSQLTSAGATVILDIHGDRDADFAAYFDTKVGGAIKSGEKVADLLENLWWQLAKKYANTPRVQYGITNEPHDIDPATWFACANQVVDGIRRAGASGRIWVPGIDWTGAGSWMTHNAAAWNIVDPLNNTGAQLHLYFDKDAGGGTTLVESTTIGSERCKDVTAWARSKGLKLFLAEVGVAAGVTGTAAWKDLYAFLQDNSDVWDGFTFWAAGPPSWWGSYQFYCGPGSYQLAMIKDAFR